MSIFELYSEFQVLKIKLIQSWEEPCRDLRHSAGPGTDLTGAVRGWRVGLHRHNIQEDWNPVLWVLEWRNCSTLKLSLFSIHSWTGSQGSYVQLKKESDLANFGRISLHMGAVFRLYTWGQGPENRKWTLMYILSTFTLGLVEGFAIPPETYLG